jgi:hypothetical protein
MAKPTATITNNLDFDVDIYDVYNTSTSDPKGLLTYTKLGAITSRAAGQAVQTIHVASSLQATRTGNIDALNKNYYVQFPVAVLPVSPFADSNSFTLSSDLQQGMEQSFQFIKYAQANPTSRLATNFRKALGDTKDTTSQATAVDAFFKGTGSFPKCTFSTWTAVVTWQAQFTSVWQGTYYLYSLGSSTTPPVHVATLAIVSSASSSAVLTMAAAEDQKTNVVMVGDGSMQEEKEGTGNQSVALTPCWLNIPQSSKKDSKTAPASVIGVAFSGTINGIAVAGNLNKLDLPDASHPSKKDNDKHELAAFVINTISQIVNTLITFGMLYIMIKDHQQAKKQRRNAAQDGAANRDQAEQRERQADEAARPGEAQQEVEARGNAEGRVPEVQQRYDAARQAVELQETRATLNRQEGRLMEVLNQGPANPSIEEATDSLSKAETELKKAHDLAKTVSERNIVIGDVETQLKMTSGQIEKQLADNSRMFTEQEQKALQNTQKALENQNTETERVRASQNAQEAENEKDPSERVNEESFENAEGREFEGGEFSGGEFHGRG